MDKKRQIGIEATLIVVMGLITLYLIALALLLIVPANSGWKPMELEAHVARTLGYAPNLPICNRHRRSGGEVDGIGTTRIVTEWVVEA